MAALTAPAHAFRGRRDGNAMPVDVLVDEANHALAARGYAREEAAVYEDPERPGWGVLRGSLVRETEAKRTDLLRIVTAFPLRDDLVAARELD